MIDLAAIRDEIDATWAPLGKAAAYRLVADGNAVGRHDHKPFEVGSCFKAFIAAECCRQVASGTRAWDEPLRVDPERRVPSSHRAEGWPDGSTVTLHEAASAMIAVSDNTATDMVLDLIGHETVIGFIEDCGLSATTIPRRVRDVYAQPEHIRPVATSSTMADLTAFYACILAPDSPLQRQAQRDVRRLLRLEDLEQGTSWPDGVVCYRKSGSLEPPPLFAMAMAGAFATPEGRAEFAFAVNVENAQESMEDIAAIFVQGVTAGMKALAGGHS